MFLQLSIVSGIFAFFVFYLAFVPGTSEFFWHQVVAWGVIQVICSFLRFIRLTLRYLLILIRASRLPTMGTPANTARIAMGPEGGRMGLPGLVLGAIHLVTASPGAHVRQSSWYAILTLLICCIFCYNSVRFYSCFRHLIKFRFLSWHLSRVPISLSSERFAHLH
jgi:hypothetical protein